MASAKQSPVSLVRRVYRPEVCELLGWGKTWLNRNIKKGNWPAGMHDEGSRRLWWPSDVVAEAHEKLRATASTEVVPPAMGESSLRGKRRKALHASRQSQTPRATK